ncbi:hypothetical protein MMC09_002213 [Bachmanniomyces sp. S44760]|nr:hypothetical protein [Bachmanniomyces sp. S44760]
MSSFSIERNVSSSPILQSAQARDVSASSSSNDSSSSSIPHVTSEIFHENNPNRQITKEAFSNAVANDIPTGSSSGSSVVSHERCNALISPLPDANRPGRFRGPPSTWRSWTKPDRLVAKSLDQLQAQDLGIHLFNAHALRQEAKRHREDQIQKQMRRNASSDYIWEPPKLWTAWPMEPELVPRPSHVNSFPTAISKKRKIRPSDDLEDVMISIMLREAKRRFVARDWGSPRTSDDLEDDERSTPDESSLPGVEYTRARVSTRNDRGSMDSHETYELPTPEDGSNNGTSFAESKIDSSVHSTKGSMNTTVSSIEAKPQFTANDDVARAIFLPTARHILSRLDNLLMGLHHGRQACAYGRDDSESQSDSDDDLEAEDLARQVEQEREMQGSGRELRSTFYTGENKQQPPAIARDSSTGNTPDFEAAQPEAVPISKGRKQLGGRDWSDILGVASIMGWDQGSVEKAAKRSSRLLGEGMAFRTLAEGGDSSSTTKYVSNGSII